MPGFLARLFRGARDSSPVRPAPRRIGLVLGGGAVRGAAHLGVMSVLEREGIRPDVVAGTSVGAVVGAGVAAGVPSERFLEEFKAASWRKVTVPAWRSRLSLLDADPLGGLIERITSAATFAELELPFSAVACDLLTGTRVVISDGPLREAIVASSAIPAIFEPVRRGAAMLCDGGLVDNLPVQAARDLGADYVIAVDIMPPLDGDFEPADIRDVIMLSWNIVQHEGEKDRYRADIVIAPDVASLPLSDFSKVDEAFAAGVAAAEAALPQLRADLGLAAADSGAVTSR